MLARKNKLTGAEVFLFFKNSRQITSSPLFNIYLDKNSQTGKIFKAGVVEQKQLKLTAVERNRIKRRTYCALKNICQDIFFTDKVIVYIKSRKILKISFADLCLIIKKTLKAK